MLALRANEADEFAGKAVGEQGDLFVGRKGEGEKVLLTMETRTRDDVKGSRELGFPALALEK